MSVFRVRIEPHGWSFDAPDHQTLMKSARQAGIEMPRSCQNGTCRTCVCTLLSGQVRYRIEWPGLSPEEKAVGCILPCVALPTSAVVMVVPGATQACSVTTEP